MKIKSLVDTFGRRHNYLRISITERCNLRCKYCMPSEGVPLTPSNQLLQTDEMTRLVKLFASAGVDKVRLTGGEPTVRKDIIPLIQGIKDVRGINDICITSNGLALMRKLTGLVEAGLTGLNLSLDTLVDGKFVLITRRNGLSAVLKSLHRALDIRKEMISLASGLPITAKTNELLSDKTIDYITSGGDFKPLSVKLNVVIMKNVNDDEILEFVNFSKDHDIEVRFIEYMPFDGNKWSLNKLVPWQTIAKEIENAHGKLLPSNGLVDKDGILSHRPGETAKVFRIAGFKGRIGFITSMTSDFCSSCNRLRITSDGNLKVCLFGEEEVSLRDLMREGLNDSQLIDEIDKAVKQKKEKHADLDTLKNSKNRAMILIGG